MSNIYNELIVTGSIDKASKEISGTVLFEVTTSGSVSIPDVIGPDPYEGLYEVEPTFENQYLQTRAKTMSRNLKVSKIKTYETSNRYGTTFII